MDHDLLVILSIAALYLVAIVIAVLRQKTFPLVESFTVMGIVGVIFTGLVYVTTLPIKSLPTFSSASPAELTFIIGYLGIVAVLLVIKPNGSDLPGHFWREKFADLFFKLAVFVVLPLAVQRIFWGTSFVALGFTLGDVPGQLFAAAILILVFGGFNFWFGSAAAPIRKRQFDRQEVACGLSLAFMWNIFETGLVEEFFFRAFLQRQLINFFASPLVGICLASLLFGLAHAPGIYLRRGDERGPLGEKPALLDTLLYAVLVLSPTGWFTGLLYWRMQSLLAPILVHAAVDAVAHTVEFINGLRWRK
jgi:membrane protease YdiL (CAAX protease family)